MSFIRPVPWTRQPQTFTPAVGGRALTAFVPGFDGVNRSHIKTTAQQAGTVVVGRQGIGRFYSGTDAAETPAGSIAVSTSVHWHLWVGRFLSAANNWRPVSFGHGSDDSGNLSNLRLESSTQISFVRRNNFATAALATSVSVPGGASTNVDVVVLGYSASQADHRAYCCANGVVAVATSTTDIGAASGTFNRVRLANSSICNHHTYLAASGNSVLSDSEILALLRNPWQLFAPITRRIWVPSTGAAPAFLGAWARGSTTIVGSGMPGG